MSSASGSPLDAVRTIAVDGTGLRLQRLWPRHSAHALVEYRTADGPGSRLFGQWFADPEAAAACVAATCAASGPPASSISDGGHVVIHRFGADRRLRPLRRLLDDPAATLVAHRPERRAVVRIDGPSDPVWAKVVRPERLGTLLAATDALASLGDRIPRLIGAAPDGTVRWKHLPGVPFADRFTADRPVPEDATAVAELLHRLHAVPGRGPIHDAAGEARVLMTWLEHLAFWDPATHSRIAPHAPAVLDELVHGAGRRRFVTVHRDAHDGQILIDCDGARILDPDTVAVGEAELDLGNIAAHVHLAARQGRCTHRTAHTVVAELLAAYGGPTDPRRLRAYTSAALLRLVAVHALRPVSRMGVDGLVEALRCGLAPAEHEITGWNQQPDEPGEDGGAWARSDAPADAAGSGPVSAT